ncbi:hypothetical protein [Sphingomonas montanisoli]|uniref:Uncharacterized protein n=1 Tax=Sphingomonas montanisoli TaxID=2606412 RepID=A0A5D9C2J3_9SPHN|nr:hypothetical protein [Sphingomonas montanisoli]TZG25879.1 hypothetical protein FYJ91_12935 [Sphingomonas montanisoli]
MQGEADKEWKAEPAQHLRGWWAAGYIYRGQAGTHYGQFVPVYHWPTEYEACAFVDAMRLGSSRVDAKAKATIR